MKNQTTKNTSIKISNKNSKKFVFLRLLVTGLIIFHEDFGFRNLLEWNFVELIRNPTRSNYSHFKSQCSNRSTPKAFVSKKSHRLILNSFESECG